MECQNPYQWKQLFMKTHESLRLKTGKKIVIDLGRDRARRSQRKKGVAREARQPNKKNGIGRSQPPNGQKKVIRDNAGDLKNYRGDPGNPLKGEAVHARGPQPCRCQRKEKEKRAFADSGPPGNEGKQKNKAAARRTAVRRINTKPRQKIATKEKHSSSRISDMSKVDEKKRIGDVAVAQIVECVPSKD